ncbi:aspartate/glutamate racemase family protein [Arthrobacter sp. AZCC_0090]|uniref:aspartate/glutamate racemase family protein n=1 Tax=Arthrobacter sp. AZCC_0090 TaxID=2735881 RepID=UPI0017EA7319|nr:aspartate/glutamate racemase family protein [Arthrobacter sp. AZCC_0090]MBB6405991.1 Asp/Glu/hydantoin racemase [Arthrobacter sp. AZCC_0090]
MGRTIDSYGKGNALTGVYPLCLGVDDFQRDHAETRARMVEAGRIAVERDHSESLILGCTMEAGFHRSFQEEIGVPVIDPSVAAIARAEHFGRLRRSQGWVPSRRWSCEAPPEAELAAIGVFDVAEPFGNLIVVPA